MLLNRDFKRLGDLAAGTIVVHTERKRASKGLPVVEPGLANSIPNVSLDLAEQRAVIDFAERRATWSTERANELASYAEVVLPAVNKNDTTDAATRVVRLANFLVGRRQ